MAATTAVAALEVPAPPAPVSYAAQLRAALERAGGNRVAAARALQIARPTIQRLLRELAIAAPPARGRATP